jgi:hypothetical protein
MFAGVERLPTVDDGCNEGSGSTDAAIGDPFANAVESHYKGVSAML